MLPFPSVIGMGVTTGVQWVGELIVVPIRDGLKSILFAGHIVRRCLGYTEVTTCLPKKWETVRIADQFCIRKLQLAAVVNFQVRPF